MFFGSWSDLGRVLVVGSLAYVALVALLRASGKRTLTKLNAFDLVVTVAFGSTLASVVLNKSVSLAEGVLAFALLVALQFAITWSSVRWHGFEKLVKAEPTLLLRNGRLLEGAMKRQRVTREEMLAVLRASGQRRIESVAAVILETDGSLSVIPIGSGSERVEAFDVLEGVNNRRA